jgi:hypothetical protein
MERKILSIPDLCLTLDRFNPKEACDKFVGVYCDVYSSPPGLQVGRMPRHQPRSMRSINAATHNFLVHPLFDATALHPFKNRARLR